jgi:hypothetical protein|tara:strand:+ start:1349 stop:1504 length:156 start_codon:yes stop_codon:yes gene_type:complete
MTGHGTLINLDLMIRIDSFEEFENYYGPLSFQILQTISAELLNRWQGKLLG